MRVLLLTTARHLHYHYQPTTKHTFSATTHPTPDNPYMRGCISCSCIPQFTECTRNDNVIYIHGCSPGRFLFTTLIHSLARSFNKGLISLCDIWIFLNRKGSSMLMFDGISFILPFKVISSRVAVICRAFSISMAIFHIFLWYFYCWNMRFFQAERSSVGGLRANTNEWQSGTKSSTEVRGRVFMGSCLFWYLSDFFCFWFIKDICSVTWRGVYCLQTISGSIDSNL